LLFSCLQQLNLIPSTLQGSAFDQPNNTKRNFNSKLMSLHGFYYINLLYPSVSLRFDKQQITIIHTKFFQNLYPELFLWRRIRGVCFSQFKENFFPTTTEVKEQTLLGIDTSVETSAIL